MNDKDKEKEEVRKLEHSLVFATLSVLLAFGVGVSSNAAYQGLSNLGLSNWILSFLGIGFSFIIIDFFWWVLDNRSLIREISIWAVFRKYINEFLKNSTAVEENKDNLEKEEIEE